MKIKHKMYQELPQSELDTTTKEALLRDNYLEDHQAERGVSYHKLAGLLMLIITLMVTLLVTISFKEKASAGQIADINNNEINGKQHDKSHHGKNHHRHKNVTKSERIILEDEHLKITDCGN